jgi:peptide/nickel transport system permease protein
LIGILFLTFLLSRLIPGDPCRAVLGEKATDVICDAFMERMGLNKPIPVQFVYYLADARHRRPGRFACALAGLSPTC